MLSIKEYILEKAMTPEEKAVNKLQKNFINNYHNGIGKMLLKHGLCTILTTGYIVTQNRTIYSSKLWKGMLHSITQKMKDQFDFLKNKDYDYVIPIQLGLEDPSKTNKQVTPGNFFEVENVGIYVKRMDSAPLFYHPFDENRKRYDCYLFLKSEDLE